MKRLRISHLTQYDFPARVRLNPHQLLLRPREGHDVRIESSQLNISPAHNIHWQRDVYDNSLAVVDFPLMADRLIITSEVVIQHYEQAPYNFLLETYAANFPFVYTKNDQIDLAAFQRPLFDTNLLKIWLQELNLSGMNTIAALVKLNQTIQRTFQYRMREEAGVQPPASTLHKRSGSCRDYATLFIETCRCMGLASRFVSGYLHAPATEAGHASTHAWAEVYLPGTGWKGFDPTSGVITGNQHIAVAVARNPETIPPVSGSFTASFAANPSMLVDVQVNLLGSG